ncbi:helix-turn-helix domain-containing protein [Actinoplanes campanulatus]|nr:helix-turn-helix transcriptional regulator [Actinoplanes campanulatus]GGN15070.1 transcriptional regulator [Actinoplanes campanulatus]GID37801.1 transcriptional regulator [Actinoplanes campanulatus]
MPVVEATPSSGSTVPRRQLGRFLRRYREAAGKTIKDAYEHIECSQQKIWRLEKGDPNVVVKSTEVKLLCDFYGVPDDVKEALVSLSKETKVKGWWHAYGDVIPEWFELYVGLETAASRLRKYEPSLIPGLLQAHAYLEAVMTAERPRVPVEEFGRRIRVKQERQVLLTRGFPPPPQLDVIMAEAVIRAKIETPGAMQQQLWHLLRATDELPHLRLRVLPSVGPHSAAASGGFTILEFPPSDRGSSEPPTVYSENITGALYLDHPRELAVYEQVWAELEELALNERDSKAMITTLLKDLGDTSS